MTYIGHPPVGDPIYAGRKKTYGLEGQALHSKSISFIHPRTKEYVEFEVDLSNEFKEILVRDVTSMAALFYYY